MFIPCTCTATRSELQRNRSTRQSLGALARIPVTSLSASVLFERHTTIAQAIQDYSLKMIPILTFNMRKSHNQIVQLRGGYEILLRDIAPSFNFKRREFSIPSLHACGMLNATTRQMSFQPRACNVDVISLWASKTMAHLQAICTARHA